MSLKTEKALQLFKSGANCAQAVLGAFAEECHLDMETAMKLSFGFGGGFARQREVCGTVSGMVLVADLMYGTGDLADKEAQNAHRAKLARLIDTFRADNGSIVCRELLQQGKRPCGELVAYAVSLLEKWNEL